VTTAPASRTRDLPAAGPATAVIAAIASGKGGTGTSTAATLLAATLASRGRQVLLVDASDRLGTLDVMLGVTPGVPLDALRGGGAEPGDLLVSVSDGLTLLPAYGAHGDRALPAAERRVLFARVASLFPRYDLVLFDAGASAESILGACASGVTRIFAVTTADRITITATYALVKLLHERHPDVRVDILASRTSAAAAAQAHHAINAATVRFLSRTVHLAGVVPEDPQFGHAIAAGLGTHDAAEGSFAAHALHDIGDRLFDPPGPPAGAPITRSLRRN
jgi:flagellar biosynthesis protein FlhG